MVRAQHATLLYLAFSPSPERLSVRVCGRRELYAKSVSLLSPSERGRGARDGTQEGTRNLSSGSTSDRRAAGGRLRRRFFVTAALLLAVHAAATAAFAVQADARPLITTATGARLRERPDAG